MKSNDHFSPQCKTSTHMISAMVFSCWCVRPLGHAQYDFNLTLFTSNICSSSLVLRVQSPHGHQQHGTALQKWRDDAGSALPAVRGCLLLCQRAGRDRDGSVPRCKFSHALKCVWKWPYERNRLHQPCPGDGACPRASCAHSRTFLAWESLLLTCPKASFVLVNMCFFCLFFKEKRGKFFGGDGLIMWLLHDPASTLAHIK